MTYHTETEGIQFDGYIASESFWCHVRWSTQYIGRLGKSLTIATSTSPHQSKIS